MSYRHKPTDFEVQQSELLGAQISNSHQEFQQWAMMDPDMAFIIYLMEHPEASTLDMLKAYAKLEFLKSTTEVTRLSMIVGSEQSIFDLSKTAQRSDST